MVCRGPRASIRLADLGQTIASRLLSQLQADPHLAHRCQSALEHDVSRMQHVHTTAAGALVCFSLINAFHRCLEKHAVWFVSHVSGSTWLRVNDEHSMPIQSTNVQRLPQEQSERDLTGFAMCRWTRK